MPPTTSRHHSIGRPLIWIRSLKRTRCGEVKSPVLIPAARHMESIIAQTDPLPFVPATWMNRNLVLRISQGGQQTPDIVETEFDPRNAGSRTANR